MFFKINEKILIKLHKEYFISTTANMSKKIKLEQQYIDLFIILKKVKKLVYCLDLSKHWRIHSVFSIAQLKTYSFKKDSFDHSLSNHSDSVFVENNTSEYKFYVMQRLLNKRVQRREQEKFTKYLVRWEEYKSKHDQWYDLKDLKDASELIQKYEESQNV